MHHRTTRTFRVRSYEIGAEGTVSHAVVLNWCQEMAYEGSTNQGYPPAAYEALGAFWVMRSVDVAFLGRVGFNDRIEATTWISDMRRVRTHREYALRQADGGPVVALARADWVFMDQATITLRRLPPEMDTAFGPDGEVALAPLAWPPATVATPLAFRSLRRVQRYELDELRHVNNAVYLNWIEQQAYAAWVAWGHDPARLVLRRHFLEYRRSALIDDELTLTSSMVPDGTDVIWKHVVQRGDELLVEARSLSSVV